MNHWKIMKDFNESMTLTPWSCKSIMPPIRSRFANFEGVRLKLNLFTINYVENTDIKGIQVQQQPNF